MKCTRSAVPLFGKEGLGGILLNKAFRFIFFKGKRTLTLRVLRGENFLVCVAVIIWANRIRIFG